jgi:hypothetical protein
MNTNEMTKGQLTQLAAKFLQIIPLDADKNEVQMAIENESDLLWVGIVNRFAKKVGEAVQAVKSVLQGLIDAGKYDYVNPNITKENFPVPADFVLGSEPKLYHLNRYISSENAIKEMDKDGYRPAMIWDLLDFGTKNPEMQRQFPIVGLGSVGSVDGDRSVPYLDERGSWRGLSLLRWGYDWLSGDRFLAVRK